MKADHAEVRQAFRYEVSQRWVSDNQRFDQSGVFARRIARKAALDDLLDVVDDVFFRERGS